MEQVYYKKAYFNREDNEYLVNFFGIRAWVWDQARF